MTVPAWVLLAVVVAAVVVAVVSCVGRARRLDRLHVRVDAARAGLVAALDRRAALAAAVATALAAGAARRPSAGGPGGAPDPAAALRTALAARAAGLPAALPAEAEENALTRALATVDHAALPPGLVGELVDAEQLVFIARRVHNDAVRDTLGLRSRRLVRWLRLAGTAPVPGYFEIADPVTRESDPGATAGATPGDPRH